MDEKQSRRKFLYTALGLGSAVATIPLWMQLLNNPEPPAPDKKSEKAMQPQKKAYVVQEFHPQELLELYVEWLKICIKKKEEAGDKPFYIIIAEEHNDPECFLFQVFLTDIAQRLGLSNRMMELDEGRLQKFQQVVADGQILKYHGNMGLGLACDDRGTIIPIDGEIPKSYEQLQLKALAGAKDKKTAVLLIEEEYAARNKRDLKIIETILQHPGGSVVMGVQHVHEIADALREKGAVAAIFSGFCKVKLTQMADAFQEDLNTLTQKEVTRAMRWKYKEAEDARNLGKIAILAPDKVLASQVRNDRGVLLEVAKSMLAMFEQTLGDIDVERNPAQVSEKFKNFANEMQKQQGR